MNHDVAGLHGMGDTALLILAWADGPNADAHITAVHELLATIEFIE